MKRALVAGLVLATVAVVYAAAGGRLDFQSLTGRIRASQRLPALRSQELPFRYPVALWRSGVEGEVLLRIHISEAGTVDSVELESSSGHAALDEIALRGAWMLKYHPALKGEEPVAVWAMLPVRFQRNSVTVPAEEN